MRGPRRAAIAAIALLAACAGRPAVTYVWTPVRENPEELEAARAACAGEAGSAVARLTARGVEAEAGVGVFLRCMESRGWRVVTAATPTP